MTMLDRSELIARIDRAQASLSRRRAPGAAISQMLHDDSEANLRGDHDLNEVGMRPDPPLKPAAVLVPQSSVPRQR